MATTEKKGYTMIYIPNGSYKETSKDLTVTLSAKCQKIDGSWQESQLDLTTLVDNVHIINVDGDLVNDRPSKELLFGYVPNGSYKETSQNIKVTLSAKCEKVVGTWEMSSIDLTKLHNAYIVNIDGELKNMRTYDKGQIEDALNQLVQWFPEEKEQINANKSLIIEHIVNGTSPVQSSPLMAMQYAQLEEESLLQLPYLTECEESIGVVAVDAVLLIIGLFGVHISNQERLARILLREIGPDTLRGLVGAVHNFNNATNATSKSWALFAIASQIWNAGEFRAVFMYIKDEMSWWEWTKTGTLMVLQITAWFLTDGIAFVAQVALSIMDAEQLIEDSIKAGITCSN